MTTAKTDYHENQVADRVFENTTPDGATDGVYVALWTTAPANAPDEANEVDDTNEYDMIQVTASGWTASSVNAPKTYDNDSEINFGVLNSGADTTVEGYVLYDGPDSATDNALWQGDDVSVVVSAGDELKFNAGDLSISED